MKKIIFLMCLISLLVIGVVSATVPSLTLETTTWNLDTPVNISLTSGANITNLAIFGSSSSTANSSTSLIINITNSSTKNFMDGNDANFTFQSFIVLEDSSDYSITAKTTGNGAADGITLTATTVTIDRTAPTVPITTIQNGDVFVKDGVITYTVNGVNTTGCIISFGRNRFSGSNTFAMTHSGDTCTYTVTEGNPPDGTYDTWVQASDGLNKTTLLRSLQIDVLESDTPDIGDGFQVGIGEAIGKQKVNGLLIAVIVIIIGFVIINNKKN